MDTNTIFSWNGFTVFQELHWQRHLRFLWNKATCEGSTPTCYSSLSHRPPIPFPTLYFLLMDTRRKRRVGAPERASHALLPPLFSLLSTTRNMHTRYSLGGFVLDGESLLLEEFFGQRQVLHIFGGQVDGIAVEVL